MAARRSTELRTVPEHGRLSAVHGGGADATAPPGNPAMGAQSGGRDGARGPGGRDSGFGSGGGSGNVSRTNSSRLPRGATSRSQMGGSLGRASLVVKLQQSGRQLIDMAGLQANWLNSTLAKRSVAQEFINGEDQGFVALLARHVEVPLKAWQTLQNTLGRPDGHFLQSGYGPGENNRGSAAQVNTHDSISPEEARGAAAEEEEGRAREALKPRARDPCKSIFGMPVIQPYNNLAVLWTMLILFLDLTYTAFWVPINVAFCTSEYGKLSSGCTTSDLVGGALYSLNLLLGFQIGVVATNGIRKLTVVDGRMVAGLYVRHGNFKLDFVASVPLVYLVVVLAGRSHFRLNKGWVNCLSLLRLLRMVRLVSIIKVVCMDSLSGRFKDSWAARFLSVTVLYSIFLAYQLAVALNLVACIMVLCAYFEGYSNSWMTAVGWANLPNASPLYQWYCAVYWMIVTATTTGFGDFQPRSVAEQVVANVAMVGGMIMFGVLVAVIGQALSRAMREAHQAYRARQKIIHVMEWAQHRNLSDKMKKQVQNFFTDKDGSKEENAVDMVMMASLPSRLRAKVASAICSPLLPELHILQTLPDDVQRLLAENMRPLRLPAGEDLCQQGDVTNCLWILQEGTIQAVRYKEEPVVLDAVEMPRLLGESVLLGEAVEAARVRSWTLRTVSPCRLWGITLGELYPLMRIYPIIGAAVAEHVKNKVVNTFWQADRAARAGGSGMLENVSRKEHWCEVAAVILRQLLDFTPDEVAEELVRELGRREAYDGTLQPLLEQLLEFCATRRGGPAAAAVDVRISSGTAAGLPSTRRTPSGAAAADGVGGEYQSPQSPQQHGAAAAVAGQTAFSTPAAAATLSAAFMAGAPSGSLQEPSSGQWPHPPHAQHVQHPQQLHLQQQLQQLHHSGAAPGLQQSYSTGGGGQATSARSTPQLAVTSPVPPGDGGGVGGGAAAAAAVQCPGCQRCICPSCGQGMDTAGPALAAAVPPPSLGGGAAAAASTAAAAGGVTGVGHLLSVQGGGGGRGPVSAGTTGAVRPGAMHAWVNVNRGSLRRVSIGLRGDSVWASERRSIDRRLGATSVMSVYE